MDALQKGQDPTSFWNEYLAGANLNDAEISIYRENQQIKKLSFFHIDRGHRLLVLFCPWAQTPTRSALQGIYLAQKEFNNDPNNTTKMQLLLANTGEMTIQVCFQGCGQIAGIVQQDKDKRIRGIIGWQTSVRTQAMLDDLHQDKVELPMVSETASYDNLPDSPHYFGLAAPDELQAELAVAEILHKNYTQVIVFKDINNLYSQNIAQDFENKFPNCTPQSSTSTCIEVPFTTESTTVDKYTAILTTALKQVRDINHLAVFFTGSTSYDMLNLQEALANIKNYPPFPIFTGDAGYVAQPASYDRWYVLAYAYHDEWSTLMSSVSYLSQAYYKTFHPPVDPHHHFIGYGYEIPDAVTIISYDTAQVVAQSVKKVLSSQSPNLQDALETITNTNPWQGVSGQIAFDSNRRLVNRALIVLKIDKDGHFQMICLQGTFSNAANNSLPLCPA